MKSERHEGESCHEERLREQHYEPKTVDREQPPVAGEGHYKAGNTGEADCQFGYRK